MSQVHIRKARLTDAQAVTKLVNRAYRPEAGSEGWTHESALVSGNRVDQSKVAIAIQSGTVLVGSDERGLIGCIQVEVVDRVAHIGMLAVDPSIQTLGIGKLLLAHAEELAVQKFDAEVAVLVVIAARTELVEYYLRRGYSMTDEWAQYPTHAGVGTPKKEAMLLATLRKCFKSQVH
ncbi:MAG: GNAT family N-acetyltransferase [Moraxellaceae bacterium]|nr:GNAT family N-acetyltransferase [Moraxellaceae bacterium]MDZ4386333.1 GNAT family N-acetyltransferase [Moraxellaceae bacterium]